MNSSIAALDRLLDDREAPQQPLVARLRELFTLDYDLLLYDVTTMYARGQDGSIPLRSVAQRRQPAGLHAGVSALVASREGMPARYEIFPSNRAYVTTVEDIVEAMEALDRDMTPDDSLEQLREIPRCNLVGTPRSNSRSGGGAG